MGTLAAGSVVSVPFPFSDLSQSKIRPALVLAGIERNDWILCQITSNPYSDPHAVTVTDESFSKGSLQRISYVRPGKLFTANEQLITVEIGSLKKEALEKVIDAVIAILQSNIR
jgi:mRNA-degrading endonuclease toxin of MazEF toxin-antitoxin module